LGFKLPEPSSDPKNQPDSQEAQNPKAVLTLDDIPGLELVELVDIDV